MARVQRSTTVVPSRLAMQEHCLAAARARHQGQRVMSFEQMAARLAGGFTRPVDHETLRGVIQRVLPETSLGELDAIKMLPGMIGAAAASLQKVWRADINLAALAPDSPRLDAMARLEAAVLAELPAGMLRPCDIAAAATQRVVHAPAIFGPIDLVGLAELPVCWRPLLKALVGHVSVCWAAGPREAPGWLKDAGVDVVRAPEQTPEVNVVSAATPYHEAIEAMRWVRALLADGVSPSEIAITSVSRAPYDPYFLALRADAGLNLSFVHGVNALTTRAGQAAAALADIVVRGLSQVRVRRLVMLCPHASAWKDLPDGWLRVLPADAPLGTPEAWERVISRLRAEDWPDHADHAATLRPLIELLAKGPAMAPEIGEAFLKSRALTIWRKAIRIGPATSVDATLETVKQGEERQACVSVAWMPAATLAASPRRYVRLLGLNASRWPRALSEDRLIPGHILPTPTLDPVPLNRVDRQAFDTILATTRTKVVLSHARRDRDGRRLGRSPLLATYPEEKYLRRNASPACAFSETDRLMARPKEFASDPQAASALACWKDWRTNKVTAHDGLVRPDHPLIHAILARTQSASSLRLLLRNPLGFVWKYAFGWRLLPERTEPLTLDPLDFGTLVHALLERSLRSLECGVGLASANASTIEAAVRQAATTVADEWAAQSAVPPAMIWTHTLERGKRMAARALSYADERLPNAHRYGEVPFGGAKVKSETWLPWDASAPVPIPGTSLAISGYIDRLDIAEDGKCARVYDYKTGKTPKRDFQLKGGSELQRCLYAFTVQALLGRKVGVRASLLYPHEEVCSFTLEDQTAVLSDLTGYLQVAQKSLAEGAALTGPDAGGDYDDFAFALPANAAATYRERKQAAVKERLGEAANVWEAA